MRETFAIGVISRIHKELQKCNQNCQVPNGLMKWADDFQKEKGKWPVCISASTPYPYLLGKCKLMTFSLTLVKTVTIKKLIDNSMCWQGCKDRGVLPHGWWASKPVQPLWSSVRCSLRKFKVELLHVLHRKAPCAISEIPPYPCLMLP